MPAPSGRQRGQGQWALGYREPLNQNEQAKKDSDPLTVKQRIVDVYAKGGDYTPQMLPETPVVERLGGQVRVLEYLSDHSTTAIVARIRATAG